MRIRGFAVILVFLVALEPALLAATPVSSPESHPAPLVVTPDNLETLLFSGNIDVAREMNNVMRAKNNVELSLAGLLPSLNLNLGAVIAAPPLFLLSSVSCLVPFLFPSNWYNYRAAQKDERAEQAGLEITRLNAYASAYALLSRFSNDEATLAALQEQYRNLGEYVETVKQRADVGLVPQLEARRAELELHKMSIDLSRANEAIGNERAQLRKLLGLGLDQEFEVRFAGERPSRLEGQKPTQALALGLYNLAPEREQLDFFLAGAHDRVKSSYWAFLAGCSGSQGSWGPQGSNAFSFATTFTISIGYGNFPQVALSKRNVDDIQLREKELELELARLLEATEDSVEAVGQRLSDSLQTVLISQQILTEQRRLAEAGQATAKDLLDASLAVTRAKMEALAAQTALEGHRVTLKRLAIEGHFADVLRHGREANAKPPVKGRRGD